MIARAFRDATLALLALSAPAFAQEVAPPPADPAAPTIPQGAPRHTSKVKLGDATIVVEHGQPPWSEERLGMMGQLPPGQVWRMGSELMTTLEVGGGPVFFGSEMIEPGRYGFNLLHAADGSWMFIVFDPKHKELPPQNYVQMIGDESNQRIAAKLVQDAPESIPAMTIDVVAAGDTASCELKWGPLRLSAPLTAVRVVQSQVQLNGNPIAASFYHRPLQPDADLTQPTIAGRLEFDLDDEDCTMNIYVMQEGDQLVALFRNKDRERWERENNEAATALKQIEAMIQQGAPEQQVAPFLQQARRRQAKNEVMLEESATRPDNLKYACPAEAAGAGKINCDLVKTRGSCNLEAIFGGKRAFIRLDESAFALKASG